jgi:hypothetical protein
VVSIGNQPDSTATAPARAGDSRLGRWARRRARQLLWVVAILAVGLFVLALGVMLSRAGRLVGLPDVGDPFDVAEFRAINTLPEDQDGVVLIRQAASKMSRVPSLPWPVMRAAAPGGWTKVDPQLRQWLAANRDALDLYRRAALRPDGIVSPAVGWDTNYRFLEFGPFVLLALLEASRLEDQGDMEGAWSWYRSALRIRLTVIRRGSVFERYWIDQQCEELQPRIESWAANRKTGVPLLRRALDDALACGPRPEWDAYSLKIDYLVMTHEIDAPTGRLAPESHGGLNVQIADMKLPDELARQIYFTRRFVLNEPELSRRVLRLAFANWLARAQEKSSRGHAPTVLARLPLGTTIPFFTAGKGAPESARTLPPDELARRLLTTHDAQLLLEQWPWWTVRIAEKRAHAGLVLLLAAELYERDHGSPPQSDQALLGRYLERLPDDGSEELADGPTRQVRQATGLEVDTDPK